MEKLNRKDFVECVLSQTMVYACEWVRRLDYDEEREVVIIICRNGYTYEVNVACDSHAAVVQDVIREVLRH